MVGLASSDAGALFLLAQDGAQPSADEAVKDAKQSRRGMLEVAEPSLKHRVEVLDDPVETVASAPDRPGPHLVLERRQALLAHQPATRFEPVAQELRSEEHTSELQSHSDLVCRLLLEKKTRSVLADGPPRLTR